MIHWCWGEAPLGCRSSGCMDRQFGQSTQREEAGLKPPQEYIDRLLTRWMSFLYMSVND